MSRILFALTPVTGHVRPALPLARALVEEGHDVVVYTGRTFAQAITATGAKHAPIVQGRDLDDAELDAWSLEHGAPAPGIKRLQWDVLHHFVATVPGFLADIDSIVAAERPDVIVMDNGFMAGAIAARRHDLPSVLFSVSPLAISSKDTAPFGMGLQPPRTGLDGLRYALLDWFTRTVVFRDVQKAAERIVADAGQPVPDGFFLDWAQTEVTRVLHPSVPSFEYPRSDLPDHVELVGPYLPAGIDTVRPARLVGRRPGGAGDRSARRAGHAGHGRDRPGAAPLAGDRRPRRRGRPRRRDHGTGRRVPGERARRRRSYRSTGSCRSSTSWSPTAASAGSSRRSPRACPSSSPVGPRTRPRSVRGWSGPGVGLALPTDKVTDGTTSQAVRDGVSRVLDNPSFARRAARAGAGVRRVRRHRADRLGRHGGRGRGGDGEGRGRSHSLLAWDRRSPWRKVEGRQRAVVGPSTGCGRRRAALNQRRSPESPAPAPISWRPSK